jgi:hypothetical protein
MGSVGCLDDVEKRNLLHCRELNPDSSVFQSVTGRYTDSAIRASHPWN